LKQTSKFCTLIFKEKEGKFYKNGLVSVLTRFYVEYEKSADNFFKMGGWYKIYLKEIRWWVADWIHQVQDMDQWPANAINVMNLQASCDDWNILVSYATVSYTRWFFYGINNEEQTLRWV